MRNLAPTDLTSAAYDREIQLFDGRMGGLDRFGNVPNPFLEIDAFVRLWAAIVATFVDGDPVRGGPSSGCGGGHSIREIRRTTRRRRRKRKRRRRQG